MASSFETVFRRAIEINMARYGSIVQTGKTSPDPAFNYDSVMMNISSVKFKAVVVLAFSNEKSSKSLMSNTLEHGQDSNVYDIYCDIANMVCGHVNRSLSREFRFSGISTPIVVEDDRMTHMLFSMKHTEKISLEAASEQGVAMKLWAFISSGDKPLAFDPMAEERASAASEAESGELELF